MVRLHAAELIWVVGLLVAVIVTAALVNRFRPIQRPRLRRLATVYALFATATGAGIGFHAADLTAWANGCFIARQILQAFTPSACRRPCPEIATELSDTLASRRVELMAAREGLDATSQRDRQASERDRILKGIRACFALG